MKNSCNFFEKIVFGFIVWLSVLFAGFLFASALLWDAYSLNMDTQEVLYKRDGQLWTLYVLAAVAVLTIVCMLIRKKAGDKLLPLHLAFTLVWIMGFGGLVIYFSRTMPAADAMSVYVMSEGIAAGDLSFVEPVTSYLAYYPHQIGLAVFFAPFVYLFNLFKTGVPAYFFIQLINVFFACIGVVFQYKSIDYIAPRSASVVKHIYLIIIGTFLPFIAYTSFVYGEIPSVMFMSMALYFALKLKNRMSEGSDRLAGTAVLLCISAVAAVMVRKNSLIFIIALAAVLLVEFICRRRAVIIVTLLITVICSVFGQKLILGVFENAAGVKIPSGVTPLSYIAMSMKSDSRAKGWYDGFNYNTYRDTDLDRQATDAIMKQVISERMDYFKAHPDEMLSFYKEKYLSQWVDGTYASRQAILATLSRKEWAWRFFNGREAVFYIDICNGFQTLMYAGFLLFALMGVGEIKRDGRNLFKFIGMIALFGVFLFHILWEANSRYSFPMVATAVSFSAAGWGMAIDSAYRKLTKKKMTEAANEE